MTVRFEFENGQNETVAQISNPEQFTEIEIKKQLKNRSLVHIEPENVIREQLDEISPTNSSNSSDFVTESITNSSIKSRPTVERTEFQYFVRFASDVENVIGGAVLEVNHTDPKLSKNPCLPSKGDVQLKISEEQTKIKHFTFITFDEKNQSEIHKCHPKSREFGNKCFCPLDFIGDGSLCKEHKFENGEQYFCRFEHAENKTCCSALVRSVAHSLSGQRSRIDDAGFAALMPRSLPGNSGMRGILLE